MGKMEQDEKNPIFKNHSPSVKRVFQIMELLARQKGNLTDISKTSGIPISTTSNILNAMVMMGYVEKDASGYYKFTDKIIKLTQGFMSSNHDLRSIAKPYMEEIVDITKETCQLGILLENTFEVLYIEKVDSPLPVSLKSYIGATLPSYCTAIGKVMLSSLDNEKLEEYLGKKKLVKQTPHTITDKEKLLSEIKLISEQGYAIDNMEIYEEARCIASPIYHNQKMIAAISVSGPVNRMSDEKINEYIPLLGEYAKKIALIFSGYGQMNI